jgi:hypothetical protein
LGTQVPWIDQGELPFHDACPMAGKSLIHEGLHTTLTTFREVEREVPTTTTTKSHMPTNQK